MDIKTPELTKLLTLEINKLKIKSHNNINEGKFKNVCFLYILTYDLYILILCLALSIILI